ncbi:MAG: putative rhamnogalacturonyl hydrolase [Bacteroidetes bacterium]|nr:putative rhamnogalacturonyl hydrolase [Bacteroidota bacterium]
MKKTHLFIILSFLGASVSAKTVQTTDYMGWAVKIADSEMKHNPELWMADFVKTPKWDYTQGLVANAMLQVFNATNDSVYYKYVKTFADFFIQENGEILTYKKSDYNIDKLNGGLFLYDLFARTKDRKYLNALNILREQLYTHPRVSEGAFWHKKIYPHQVWLDGLYMGSPFYIRYGVIFDVPEIFSDVTKQFIVADKHTLDPKTGLNYHGWDESKTQKWANPVTGQSPNFWSRSMGWYMMALVDVLEYLPLDHPDRAKLLKILNRLSASLVKYQDKKTGMWYQVTNLPKRSGNYLESTGTAMFAYAFAKGVNNGFLPAKYKKYAVSAFDGLVKNSTVQNADGTYSITKACSVAGLGGTPYRDGSFEYYINEPVRSDDPKVIGPFIMAALELVKMK